MTRREMGSEYLRDASVLVLIFATLDKVIRPGLDTWTIVLRSALIAMISLVLYLLGGSVGGKQ